MLDSEISLLTGGQILLDRRKNKMSGKLGSLTGQRITSGRMASPPARPQRTFAGCAGTCAGMAILLVMAVASMPAQTFTVLHSFTGVADGAEAGAGLVADRAGNLYGTTIFGGQNGFGLVYKLSERNGNWLLTPLYSFKGGDDGANPQKPIWPSVRMVLSTARRPSAVVARTVLGKVAAYCSACDPRRRGRPRR